MKLNEWHELNDAAKNIGWPSIDNTGEPPMDILDEHYHPAYGTVTCPHCECTLNGFVVMPYHYCYVCGGRFKENKVTCSRCDYNETSYCDCGDDPRTPKEFSCNECAYAHCNCDDPSIACDDEDGYCDFFQLKEDDNG